MLDNFTTFELKLCMSLSLNERQRVSHLPQVLDLDGEDDFNLRLVQYFFFRAIIRLVGLGLFVCSFARFVVDSGNDKRAQFLVRGKAAQGRLVQGRMQLFVKVVFAYIEKGVACLSQVSVQALHVCI